MEKRVRAMEKAVSCVLEMYRFDRACFAGVRLPRDVVEHCIVPALVATGKSEAWDTDEASITAFDAAAAVGLGWIKSFFAAWA